MSSTNTVRQYSMSNILNVSHCPANMAIKLDVHFVVMKGFLGFGASVVSRGCQARCVNIEDVKYCQELQVGRLFQIIPFKSCLAIFGCLHGSASAILLLVEPATLYFDTSFCNTTCLSVILGACSVARVSAW